MRAVSLGLLLLVVLAGCTGTLAEYRSSPATIPEAAYAPAGYVHGNTTEVPLTYPVGVGPVTRDVTVYVWVSGYSKTVADPETERNATTGLLVVSSPNERVAGQSVNPFAHLTNRELVSELFDLVVEAGAATNMNVTDVADFQETGVQNRTVLGQRTEVVTYTAAIRTPTESETATARGDDRAATAAGDDAQATAPESTWRSVAIHLVAVEHGEDVVLALGVHGDSVDESAAIGALVERIEHDVQGTETGA